MAKQQGDELPGLSPEESFTLLGNETRIRTLRTLAEADGPLSFTQLRNRVGIRQGSQFTYHLDKLVGHFVKQTDDGYLLTRTGERVVEAVLSGILTEDPMVDRTRVELACELCGGPTEVRYRGERFERFCIECSGMWNSEGDGYLGSLALPPAGLADRTTTEAVRAGWTWRNLDFFAMASGLCPKCSSVLDRELDLCADHDIPDGGDVCGSCGGRYAAKVRFDCSTCLFDGRGTLPILFMDQTEFLSFLFANDRNPIAADSISDCQRVVSSYDEEVISTDPFQGRFTFEIDGDTISLTVDQTLDVIDVTW